MFIEHRKGRNRTSTHPRTAKPPDPTSCRASSGGRPLSTTTHTTSPTRKEEKIVRHQREHKLCASCGRLNGPLPFHVHYSNIKSSIVNIIVVLALSCWKRQGKVGREKQGILCFRAKTLTKVLKRVSSTFCRIKERKTPSSFLAMQCQRQQARELWKHFFVFQMLWRCLKEKGDGEYEQ